MSEIIFGRRLRVSIYKQGLSSDEIAEALSSTQTTNDDQSDTPSKGSGILRFEINEDLPVEFEITKSLDNSGKNNSASMRIYGISEDTAKTMGHQMLSCKIEVGYKGQPLVPIFFGDIISASYKKDRDGNYADFEMSQSYLKQNAGAKISATYPRNTTLGQVISDVMDYFGISIRILSADTDLESSLDKELPYGMSIDGSLAECLQKILKPFGMKWHINDANIVEIFQDDVYENNEGKSGYLVDGKLKLEEKTQTDSLTSTGLMIYELDGDSGLVGKPYLKTEQVTRRLGEVKAKEDPKKDTSKNKQKKTEKKVLRPKIKVPRQIVEFRTLLFPDIQPKTVVKIVSSQEAVSGLYGILEVKYKGKTFDTDWYCDCVGVATDKKD